MWLCAQLASRGRVVATNIELKSDHPYYDRICRIGTDDTPIVDDDKQFWSYIKRPCTYIIDEADIFYDCRDHSKTARQFDVYLKQHRKRRDDVVFIVQYPDNLYVRIRRLTQEWVWCYKDGGVNIAGDIQGWMMRTFIPERFWRFRRTYFGHAKMRASDVTRTGYFTFAEASEMFGWYRTDQLIGQGDFNVAA